MQSPSRSQPPYQGSYPRNRERGAKTTATAHASSLSYPRPPPPLPPPLPPPPPPPLPRPATATMASPRNIHRQHHSHYAPPPPPPPPPPVAVAAAAATTPALPQQQQQQQQGLQHRRQSHNSATRPSSSSSLSFVPSQFSSSRTTTNNKTTPSRSTPKTYYGGTTYAQQQPQQQQPQQQPTLVTSRKTTPPTQTTTTTTRPLPKQQTLDYPYPWTMAAFLVPTAAYTVLGQLHASSHPLAWALYMGLVLYAMDLAQWRTPLTVGLWMTAVGLTLTTAWYRLLETDDDHGGGGGSGGDNSGTAILLLLLEIFTAGIVYTMCAAAVQATCTWQSVETRYALLATLHAVLPAVATAVGTQTLQTRLWVPWYGAETTALIVPLTFALALWGAMMMCASLPVPQQWQEALWKQQEQEQQQQTHATVHSHVQRQHDKDDDDNDKNHSYQKTHQNDPNAPHFWISSTVAWGHLALLYTVPVAMHLATHLRRILSTSSSSSSWQDVWDLILVSIVPYLMGQVGCTWCHTSGLCPNPYASITTKKNATKRVLGATHGTEMIQRAVLLAMVAMAVQQRYLLRWALALSYYFFDNDGTAAWILTLYWVGAVLCLLFVAFFWGRTAIVSSSAAATTTSNTNGPNNNNNTHAPALLMGEYHEDVVQLALSAAGLCLGKAFGLPWNFVPLPVLAFLGVTLWMTTRMLRYLAIFLFVIHATGVVIFTYRFAGIDQSLILPVGLQVSLVRLGLLVTFTSIGAGLVTGLAVRSAGGVGAQWLKRFDATGWLWVLYVMLLSMLEIALWKRPVPTNELVGVSVANAVEEPLYDTWWAYGTAFVVCLTTAFCRRVKIMGDTSAAVTTALAVGKALSMYVDMAEQSSNSMPLLPKSSAPGYDVWLRSLVTALVCVVLFAPRVFLDPVHVKAHRHGTRTSLPAGASRLITIYTLGFLPLALMVAIPFVVYPLANAIRGDWRGDSYYRVQAPISELAGSTLLLWGLACLAMLNHYLPDGGGEVWKKLAALAFLMGVGVLFAAPTLGIHMEAAANPYAAISSFGSQLIRKGKGRTGGWGLLAACFATLLAITGPLELREKRNDAGRKDGMLLFRTMVFSLMFGGGLAWFLVMLCMKDATLVFLVLTSVCCLTIAFLGTIAAVLGHFVSLQEFSEVTQVFSIWLIALPTLAPISGLPQLLGSTDAHPFGVDGWLSTYLVVAGAAALAFCLSVRSRSSKNPATRGIANTACILAWFCALTILYGRYGVAGMDFNYDVTTVMGLPASVFGTIAVMPILLCLEGESGGSGRTRRVTSSTKTAKSSLGITLSRLTAANSWVMLVVATASVFILASFYAICLRGAGIGSLFGFSAVARSHQDVFASVFGSATSEKEEHDLATLADRAISHSQALATSAKLAASGFWTSASFVGPLWHLLGLLAVLPSLYFLVQEKWLGGGVAASTIVTFLPVHLLPMLLCRGVPSLQAAAAVSCLGGLIQWSVHHQTEYQSKMSM